MTTEVRHAARRPLSWLSFDVRQRMKSDGTWASLGVSEEVIRASAERLAARGYLPQRVHRFFEQAGLLMLHSWYQYSFASVAYFHAVLGVEKALRVNYDAGESAGFRSLFEKAVEDGIVHDALFAERRELRKELTARLSDVPSSYSATLAALVPALRNEYFHGEYIMADDFLPLSLRLREIADALSIQKRPNKAPEPTPGAVTPRATEGDSE